MDITVIIPSRGRPRTLSAVLSSAHLLESCKHNVKYVVACDVDDRPTIEMCYALANEKENSRRIPLFYNVGERPPSLGGLVNEMALKMPADVYTALGDDLIVASAHWDDVIAHAVEEVPHGVFWWKNGYPDVMAMLAIVTEKWRAAAEGIFSDDYPFWFDDLCLSELWAFTTDNDNIPLPITIVDKPFKTIRMRDLWFWREFFSVTRSTRVKQAYQIAKKLGLPPPQNCAKAAADIKAGLKGLSKEFVDALEKNQGETSPPDPTYLFMKRRAEAIMAAAYVPAKPL